MASNWPVWGIFSFCWNAVSAARVCEPMAPSSEPGEMPCCTSATWASKRFWTGRAERPAGPALVGPEIGGGAVIWRVSGGLAAEAALGRDFLPDSHQSRTRATASARASSQYKKLPGLFRDGNRYLMRRRKGTWL